MTAADRYSREADLALSRLCAARTAGDAARADHWHRAYSLALAAHAAELRSRGGARALLRAGVVPLRPLPPDLPPLADPPPAVPPPVPAPPPAPAPHSAAVEALVRVRRIENALRNGGPNPVPDELIDADWEVELADFRHGGPYDCGLLQHAERHAEDLAPPSPACDALRECLDTYAASLYDLTDDDLRADAEEARRSGRPELALLLETELAVRERL